MIVRDMFYRFIILGLAIALTTSVQAQELTDKQRSLAGRFTQLEQILFRLAETSGSSNPRQATLLKRALLESKDKLLVQRFETLINTIERRQFSEAVAGQSEIEQDLILLLQLLESVDREESREREKEAIQEFLKDLEEILHNERVLLHQTQQQDTQNLPTLEQDQRDIRMQAQALQERIAEHEGVTPQSMPNDSPESQDGQQQDGQQQDGQQQDGHQQDGQQQDGQQQDGQQQDGQQQDGQQQDGQQQDGQQQDGQQESQQQQQNQPQREQSPTQQAMQRALEQMREAEERLQQAEREGAVEAQEEAIAELQRLKEELERILRQIREEELMQTLERLEARFQRMIQQEQGIRAQTERLMNELAASPAMQADRQFKIRADRLGIEQQSVIDDAESALILLREDGTAQAMVESLLQARFDMTEVKKRLEQTMLDSITLHIEDAIIEALQEMLEAVRAAIEEARERQENAENQEQGEGGEMGEEPLIQLLAELRMIRSMQRRVNDRTLRYDDEIKQALETPDADLSPLRMAVEELARQQNRISRILHEIRIGRIR